MTPRVRSPFRPGSFVARPPALVVLGWLCLVGGLVIGTLTVIGMMTGGRELETSWGTTSSVLLQSGIAAGLVLAGALTWMRDLRAWWALAGATVVAALAAGFLGKGDAVVANLPVLIVLALPQVRRFYGAPGSREVSAR